MVLAAVQPVYLPWLGYFEQIAIADRFLLVDDVKYSRHDWRNRNRIYTADGPMWLTVPVEHQESAFIQDVKIVHTLPWQHKHLRAIEYAYRRCPHFQPLFDDLARLLESTHSGMAGLNEQLIRMLCRYLKIDTPISLTSEIPRHADASDKNGRIVELCAYYDADILYVGPKAAAYLDVERLRRHGTDVVFQDYIHPTYGQRFSPFVSHLSVIDLIFNTGDDAPAILRSSPLPAALRESPG